MIVIDASAMVELLFGTELGREVEGVALGDEPCHAPHLLDIEVCQVCRRFVASGQLSAARARQAIEDLTAFPLRRHGHTALLDRVFALRANFTAYDATYVALAEGLDATLVTCDAALTRAPRGRARVQLVG